LLVEGLAERSLEGSAIPAQKESFQLVRARMSRRSEPAFRRILLGGQCRSKAD
jgi:hypothetical protein